MKKLIVLSLVVVTLFAFIACKGEPGGKTGGGSGEMSAAEQAILNKYGEDIFYFAELADIAASSGELVEEICSADASERAAIVSMYSSFGMQISNASATTVSVRWTEEGTTVTVDYTNVNIEPSKGLNDSISFDADVSVSGNESYSAQVSLEIDLVNNTTTITKGRYKTIVFGSDSQALQQANECLKEIEALDESGNSTNPDNSDNPNNPNPVVPNPGQAWVGEDSIPFVDNDVLDFLTNMIGKFEIKFVEYVTPGNDSYYNEYTYGQYGDNYAWATRRDYCSPQLDPDFEPQFDGVGLDRDPGHQVHIPAQDNAMSDYLCFEQNMGNGEWFFNMAFTYDEEEDWNSVYGSWLDNEIYMYFSYLLYPYSEIGKICNGRYKRLNGTAQICGFTCTRYQYVNDILYIDENGLCLRWTKLDNSGKEQIKYTVTKFDTTDAEPPFVTIDNPDG